MKQPVQFYPCTLSVTCDTWNCLKRASYFIGRPDAPLTTSYKVCQSCAESIIESGDKVKPKKTTTNTRRKKEDESK